MGHNRGKEGRAFGHWIHGCSVWGICYKGSLGFRVKSLGFEAWV